MCQPQRRPAQLSLAGRGGDEAVAAVEVVDANDHGSCYGHASLGAPFNQVPFIRSLPLVAGQSRTVRLMWGFGPEEAGTSATACAEAGGRGCQYGH